ncbi:MAG TPA: efflux transporter outer membrane subunit [Anaeromyxobacter sp.]
MPSASRAAAAALLAAGCTLAPRYQRPAAPVPSATAGAPAAPGAPDAADLGWSDVFGDERLRALIALALANNRDLRVAGLNVELTRAQHRIQRAQEFPAVSATASGTRQRVPADLSLGGKAVTTSAYSVGGALSAFELDFFGRLRSLSASALEQFLQTEEARRSAHLSLVAAVATQYLAIRALDDQIALARSTLETLEASYALTQRTYEAGRTAELDLRTAEAQVHTARFNLSAAELQRDQAENALAVLAGAPLPATLPAPQPLDGQRIVAELPSGVPSDALQRRPDVLAAEHALRSANASIGAARAAFFPSITLTASGGKSSAELSSLFAPGADTWSFSPRINLPIFTGGALRASLDVAEVRKSIEIARYERAVQVAFREVADALAARAAIGTQLRAQEARVRAERRRYELSDLRYRKGVDSYLVVLTAQRDLFAAQQQLIQSRLAGLTNLVDLYRALGGGWRERSVPDGAQGGPKGT